MKRYWFLLLIIVIFSLYFLKDIILLETISALIYLRDELGKHQIGRLNFELADYEEQILPLGETEKYVLKASDGNSWLFKSFREDEINTLVAYRLANILGIDTPEMYKFAISINDVKRIGTLQKMVLSCNFINTDVLKKNVFHSGIKNLIFSQLIYIPYSDIELLLTSSGTIYQVDLNNAFDWNSHEEDDDLAPLSFGFDRGDINLDFRQAYALLKHIEEIENGWLVKYLKRSIGKYKLQSSYIDNIINMLLDRKKTLLRDFQRCFSMHPDFHNEDLRDADSFSYRLRICKKLFGDILKKCFAIPFLKNQENKNRIEVISSGNAWRFLDGHIDDWEPPTLSQQLSDTENQLISLRYNCDDIREKIAITLYMRQIRTIKEYLFKHNDFECLSRGRIIVPIVYKVDELNNPDKWFSFVDYQTKGKVDVVKAKGEDEYMMGLINLVNQQYTEAKELLVTAQRAGYAFAEIKDVLENSDILKMRKIKW